MFKKFSYLLFGMICLVACNDENKIEEEIAKIPVDLKIDRFDQDFAAASPQDLPQLKKNFPAFVSRAVSRFCLGEYDERYTSTRNQ